MERRQDPRIPAGLPGTLEGLSGDPEPGTPVLIENISEGGIQFEAPERLDTGSFVVLRIHDARLIGEVVYSRPAEYGYLTGLLVERVLLGESELSRLIETMLAIAY